MNHPELSPRVLAVLEAVEWRWDINQVLAQPEAILDDVLYLRSLGELIRKYNKRDETGNANNN